MLRLLALDPIQQVSLDLPFGFGNHYQGKRMVTDLDFETAHAKQKQVSIRKPKKISKSKISPPPDFVP